MPVPIMLAITMENAVRPIVRRGLRLQRTRFSGRCHFWIDNPEIIRASEFFRSALRFMIGLRWRRVQRHAGRWKIR
jgi:hypothetical protein